MHKRVSVFFIFLLVFCIFFPVNLKALDLDEPAAKMGVFGAICVLSSLHAMTFDIKQPVSKELFLGYGFGGKLENRGEYIYNQLAFDFSYMYDDNSFWRYFQFQLEPFISFVSSPDENGEIGCVFFIKYAVPWDFPVKPYVRGGSGVILITQESEELSTMFNFASQLVCGLSYQMPNAKLSLEYRGRHISNAGIKEPNSGIDTFAWFLGIEGLF